MSVHMLSHSNFGNNTLARRSMKLPYQETSEKCKNGLHYTEAYRFLSSFLRSWSFFFNSIMGGKTMTHREGGIKTTTTKKNQIPNTLKYGPQKKIMQNSPQRDTIPLFCVYLWWCFYTLRKNCCEAYKFIRQTHVLLVPLKVTASYGAFLSF